MQPELNSHYLDIDALKSVFGYGPVFMQTSKNIRVCGLAFQSADRYMYTLCFRGLSQCCRHSTIEDMVSSEVKDSAVRYDQDFLVQ